MNRAFVWLTERGGVGTLDSRGRMVAKGDVATHIAPETWLRLVAADAIIAVEGRLVLSEISDVPGKPVSQIAP